MNPATVVSIVASAIEAVMAVLAFLFSRAPGWKHLKVFALVAASASAYSAISVAFSIEAFSNSAIAWALRLNWLAACVHCAAWLVYCRLQYGDPLRRRDRAAALALGSVAVFGLIPGVLATDGIVVQHVPWAGVTYRAAVPTLFGSALMLALPLVFIAPLVRYYQKARAEIAGARSHFLAFCAFFVLALNEALVALGIIENVYLADVGFLIAVLSVVSEMASRAAADAKWLLTLSTELSTEVEERTRELVKTREGLFRAERLSALGRLSASVGHEINNPLSYIVGNLDYAIEELDPRGTSKQVLEALDDARGGAERITKIVRELRVFGKGSPEQQRELTDPCECLDSALKLTGNEIRCRARLVRDLDPMPAVLADPTRLTQVFVNLLLNAVQSIPEPRTLLAGSVITLRSRRLVEGYIAIEVSDTGSGISEHAKRQLFEPFFTTKPQDQGTGLGLFVSLGIVTGLGGKIEIDSEVGVGTTVRVLLPVAPSGSSAERPTIPPSFSVRDRRVLVVDDDVLVLRTMARLLKEHRVEVVTSGQDARRRLLDDGTQFDLILCDLMMPDMTGMELFEEIERCDPALAERFVFISGGGVTDRSRRFIERHRERVLPKPIDSRAITQVLTQHARRTDDDVPANTVPQSPLFQP